MARATIGTETRLKWNQHGMERARCANGAAWNENSNFLLTCTVVPYPHERGEYRPTTHFELNFLLRSDVHSNMHPCVAALENAAQVACL